MHGSLRDARFGVVDEYTHWQIEDRVSQSSEFTFEWFRQGCIVGSKPLVDTSNDGSPLNHWTLTFFDVLQCEFQRCAAISLQFHIYLFIEQPLNSELFREQSYKGTKIQFKPCQEHVHRWKPDIVVVLEHPTSQLTLNNLLGSHFL